MAIWRKAAAAAVSLTVILSAAAPSTVVLAAPAHLPPPPHTALQTADRFIAIAYRYKGWWWTGHGRNLGKRDVRYASATLDKILRGVGLIFPVYDPSKINWFPGTGVLKTRRVLPDGTVAMGIRLPIEEGTGAGAIKFDLYAHLHVRKIRGYWKVVGVTLVEVYGPDRYCVLIATSADCSIFPDGSS